MHDHGAFSLTVGKRLAASAFSQEPLPSLMTERRSQCVGAPCLQCSLSGAPISEEGNFASAPSAPCTGKPSASFASCVCADDARNADDCAPLLSGTRRVMWIVRVLAAPDAQNNGDFRQTASLADSSCSWLTKPMAPQ